MIWAVYYRKIFLSCICNCWEYCVNLWAIPAAAGIPVLIFGGTDRNRKRSKKMGTWYSWESSLSKNLWEKKFEWQKSLGKCLYHSNHPQTQKHIIFGAVSSTAHKAPWHWGAVTLCFRDTEERKPVLKVCMVFVCGGESTKMPGPLACVCCKGPPQTMTQMN